MPVTASPTVPGAILLRKTAKTMPNITEFIMVPHEADEHRRERETRIGVCAEREDRSDEAQR